MDRVKFLIDTVIATVIVLVVAVGGSPSGLIAQGRTASIRVVKEMPIPVGSPQASVVEPFLAVNPTDGRERVGAAIRLDRDGQRIVVFNTSDGGRNWHARQLTGLADVRIAADPWLYWSPSGTLYLSILTFVPVDDGRRMAIWMYTSDDGGRSWSNHVQLPWAERGSYDHPIIASDPRLAGAPMYVVATNGLSGFGVLRSASGPNSFMGPEQFVPDDRNNNLGGAVALGENRVVFIYFDMSTGGDLRPLWAVRSVDGGRNFERTLIRRGVVPWGFPALAADVSASAWSERVYATWLESPEQGGLDVMLAHSDDDGLAWSSPVVINSDRTPNFRGRPFIAVNGDGVVGVTWNDRRHAEAELCSDVYFAASLDGGDSFLPEVRVSTTTACNPENTELRWAMGGDYSNMATSSDGRFHIVWGDARTGVHQLYAAEVAVEQ